ncbi:MAG: cobalt-precorrin-6A reductase [Cyanobacteria bacterium P01_G01_bin.49]
MGQKVGKIWLVGGTGESRNIAKAIADDNFHCIVTVTTTNAKTLYPINPKIAVKIGKLDSANIYHFCHQEKILAIVDASHPYAVKISQQVMQIAQQQSIPYLRYERPFLTHKNQVIELDSFDSLIQGDFLLNKRVLLTVGYQALSLFKQWQNKAILYGRILPRIQSLQVALKAGFTEERLIALRPPIKIDLEKALWQQWKINLVVSKASGKQGGEYLKAIVAEQLKIPLIIIKRPPIVYPQQTDKISDIINFCRQYC